MGEAVGVLRFEGVSKSYRRSHLGRVTVSRGIEDQSFEVARGEALGLLGLNGSGKTTTFKLALGLLRPDAGKLALFGAAPGPATLAQVGFLPELPYFYSHLSAEESLRFYGRLSGLAEAELGRRVPATLARVGLAAAARRRVGEFSKGMVQRVGLAQAILHEPRLLVLDEPVSGLDPLAIKDFREILLGLSERGTTLLLSSHSISELEKVCHRVLVLKEGRLARTLAQKDWQSAAGGLEALFVETVR